MNARITQEIDPKTGVVKVEKHHLNGRLHRDPKEGPAYVWRDDDGAVAGEYYYWHGRLHREDGPAKIEYNLDGGVALAMYYRHGLIHRDPKEGPAWTVWVEAVAVEEHYCINDEPYRDPADGPRSIYRSESGRIEDEQYCKVGEKRPGRPSRKRPGQAPAKKPSP